MKALLRIEDLVLLILLQVYSAQTEQMTLIVPNDPVAAQVGENVLLPCQLSPNVSAVQLEVKWLKLDDSQVIHTYVNGADLEGKQSLGYRGRTRLFKEELGTGNVSLQLSNVKVSDKGKYECYVVSSTWFTDSQINLKVMETVELAKRDLKTEWEKLQENSVSVTLDPDTAHCCLIVSEDGKRVRNEMTEQDVPDTKQRFDEYYFVLGREGFTSGRHYWEVDVGDRDSWKLGVTCESATRKGRFDLSPSEGYWVIQLRSGGGLCALNVSLLKNPEKVGVYLDYEGEWEKLQENSVSVTLDPDTAHCCLIVSEDGKRVRNEMTEQDVPDTKQRFDEYYFVLGREGFTSGRHYWEVDVGDRDSWKLGVTCESAERKGQFDLNPSVGYWVIHLRSGGVLCALNVPLLKNLQKVGVYLDYEEGKVSFYRVEDYFHIYTFTDKFSKKLYPFFDPGIGGLDLVILRTIKDGSNDSAQPKADPATILV
ncbi:UNVERIFIED_CONTAM: hypothetical protein FKN15_033910 [Acipenser sinensis]